MSEDSYGEDTVIFETPHALSRERLVDNDESDLESSRTKTQLGDSLLGGQTETEVGEGNQTPEQSVYSANGTEGAQARERVVRNEGNIRLRKEKVSN